MKPNWKDAPEWAEWLAMDASGAWFWYENEPTRLTGSWESDNRIQLAKRSPKKTWRESLEHRPEAQP